MSIRVAIVLCAIVLSWAGAHDASARATGGVNLLIGGKALNKDDWAPFENQSELGLQMTFGQRSWPVLIAVDLVGSRDEEAILLIESPTKTTAATVAGSTGEVNLGVRKEWGRRGFHPYLGGGVTLVSAKIEFIGPNNTVLSESHGGAGAWIGGGGYWRVGRHVNVGLSLRVTAADVDVNTLRSVASGGGHVALLVGYGWPPRRH